MTTLPDLSSWLSRAEADARLALLTVAARKAIGEAEDGITIDGLAGALDATADEARDTAQALGPEAAWYCSSRGWRIRLRSREERKLVAANDNAKAAA
ncbi:hypothetical protein VQ044_14060 [Aurantimonas sp. C2-5-R2]|uniref:hypothetical protein n=1 Tax=Aurantimonas sp. C2-5-R2 TaxID=3113713 RepID=UPI002F92414D